MRRIWEKAKGLLGADWLTCGLDRIKAVPPLYAKSFIITFLLINVVFSFYTFHFLWGDHDWKRLLTTVAPSLWAGRFFNTFFVQLLFEGRLLPVFNGLLFFAGLALSGIALCVYWKVPRKTYLYVIIAGLVGIIPYNLFRMYYMFELVCCSWSAFLMILALILTDGIQDKSVARKLLLVCIATALVVFSLASYTPVLNTLAVVFVAGCAVDFLKQAHFVSSKKYSLLSIILGGVGYKLLFSYYASIGVVHSDSYNIQLIQASAIPAKIIPTIKHSFEVLHWTSPVMSQTMLRLLLGLVILGFISGALHIFMEKKSLSRKIVKMIFFAALFCGTIAATQTVFLLAQSYADFGRVLFFSMPYLYAFCLALILGWGKPLIRNIAVVLLIPLFFMFVTSDMHAQKAWKLSFDAEIMRVNRMLDRIEQTPGFNPNKQYTYIQVGEIQPNMAQKFFYVKHKVYFELATYAYFPGWRSGDELTFYYPKPFVKQAYNTYSWAAAGKLENNAKLQQAVKECKDAFAGMEAWPSPQSVRIVDETIIVVWDEKNLAEVLAWLRQQEDVR